MNSLDREIKPGEVVVLRRDAVSNEFRAVKERIFVVSGGFGCKPETMGTKVFGYFKVDEAKDVNERSTWVRGGNIDAALTTMYQNGVDIEALEKHEGPDPLTMTIKQFLQTEGQSLEKVVTSARTRTLHYFNGKYIVEENGKPYEWDEDFEYAYRMLVGRDNDRD